ncbi:hypothetical protein DXG01_008343, partial [Tephrocybe rancida]
IGDETSCSGSSSPAYVPTPSTPPTPRRVSPRKLKRKALRDAEPSLVKKKRDVPAVALQPSSSIEEITSFSTSPTNTRKVPPRHAPTKAKSKSKVAPLRKVLALDLRTVMPTAHNPGPPTSPIEEISIIESASELKPAPSKMYLEVKQRIAAHASSKQKDKLLKLPLPPKPVSAKSGNATVDDDDNSVVYLSSGSSESSRPSSPVNAASTSAKRLPKKPQPSSNKIVKANDKGKEKEKPKSKATKSKKKEKPLLVSPEEYAKNLIEKINAKMVGVARDSDAPIPQSKFLHGMNFFYTGGDMTYASERTRGRMDLIVRHGGTLLPRYDASITTHIVTDASAPATMRAMGIKNLSEIPNHIPTITWKWIVNGISSLSKLGKDERVRMGELFVDAAFSERIDAGKDLPPAAMATGKGKEKAKVVSPPENAEFSIISEFTQENLRRASTSSAHPMQNVHGSEDEDDAASVRGVLLSPPTSPQRPGGADRSRAASSTSMTPVAGPSDTSAKDDPLAEFYAKARAEAETEWARPGEAAESEVPPTDSDTEEPIVAAGPPKKRGWTCDTKETQRQTCVNQDIIIKLEELKALHAAKLGDEDRWRVFSYSKCIRALRNHPQRISSFAEARAIRGVGEKTATKIMEIIETGGLRRIGYEKSEDITTTKIFQGVYGVGQATAYQWYAAGCRSLTDVVAGKGGVKLTPAQEIGIRFYDDINERMPREEAKEIFELIKPMALKIDPKLFVEIMGSYRRGKADCGDIDIMITRPPQDGTTHEGVLPKLLARLHAAGIITEDLALPEDPGDLEAIYRGLCRAPGREGSKRRRIDFLTVPWASRGAALLYYTGDDIFNRAIRMKAGVLGYSLNQKGLFGGVVRDPRDRRVKLNADPGLGLVNLVKEK